MLTPGFESSGMLEDIRRSKAVPPQKWGTDIDIVQALGESLTTNWDDIKSGGTYILSPVSLTEKITGVVLPHQPMQNKLEECLEVIKRNNIGGRIRLVIPVNCGNNHWKKVVIEINDKKISSVVLWDSMSGTPDSTASDPAVISLQTAIDAMQKDPSVRVQSEFAGIQKNGYSCMDYVVQGSLRDKGESNAITRAQDLGSLREAIIFTIAKNKLGEKEARELHLPSLSLGEGASVQQREKRVALVNDVRFKDKKFQEDFDGVFAKKLSAIYRSNPDIKDEDAGKQAYKEASEDIVARDESKTDEPDSGAQSESKAFRH